MITIGPRGPVERTITRPPSASARGARPALDDVEEFGPGLGSSLVVPAPEGDVRHRLDLAHTSHLRTEVDAVQVDRDPVRLQYPIQSFDHLLPDALLDGEAPREQ